MNARFQGLLKPAAITLGLALLLAYSMLPLSVSAPNERSRLYLTVALFERHSFNIDLERERFGSVLDEAAHAGHYYSDKAPGSSLVALPSYALLRAFEPASEVTTPQLLLLGRYAVMLPLSLVGFWATVRAAMALGVRPTFAQVVALLSLLATPAFHYAAAFFGHHLVAVYWVLCLWLLHPRTVVSLPSRLVRAWCIGCLLSLAQLTEYQAVTGTLCLTVYALYQGRAAFGQNAMALLLGALPVALFFAIYHYRSFGGVFEFSYAHLSHSGLAAVHGQGIGGVVFPRARGMYNATFTLHRGLLATSPVLLLCPLGVLGLWRRGNGALALALSGLVLAAWLFMSGSLTWEAGWGYGPRLLLPLYPLLFVLVAVAMQSHSHRPWFWAAAGSLALASALGVQLVTACFVEPPVECKNPLLDLVVPLLRAGVVPPNLGSRFLGVTGLLSLLPLGLLLCWPVLAFYRAAVASTGRRWWLLALPLAPLALAAAVWAEGASTTTVQQAELIRYVESLSTR